MAKLGTAIIGCGSIFDVHAQAIKNSSSGQLISVVDIDQKKAEKAALRYDCVPSTDYNQVLNDKKIDVIHICTPHYLHSEMALQALQAGKHVLTEKPIAIKVKDAQEMIAAAASSNRYLGVVFQNRYNKTSIAAKEILQTGELGKIKGIKGIVTWFRDQTYYNQAEWRGTWSKEGGGVLINQAIHTLDLLQWLAGKVDAVTGHVDNRLLEGIIEVEDTAEASLFFKNGVQGIFYATNCFTTNSPVEIEVHCEKGILSIKSGELIIQAQGGKEPSRKVIADYTPNGEKSYWGQGHKILIEDFYHHIIEKTTGYVSGRDGLESLKIIEGIYQSSETGKKVFL